MRSALDAGRAALFDAGLANRRAVLGDAYVDRALAKQGGFAWEFQQFITRYRLERGLGPPRTGPPNQAGHRAGDHPGAGPLGGVPAAHQGRRWSRTALARTRWREVLIQAAIYAGVPGCQHGLRQVTEEILADLARGMSEAPAAGGADRIRRRRSPPAPPRRTARQPRHRPSRPTRRRRRRPRKQGPRGLRFDFNQGARLILPRAGRRTGPGAFACATSTPATRLFETTLVQGFINSSKRWFVRFRPRGVGRRRRWCCGHDYDARDQRGIGAIPDRHAGGYRWAGSPTPPASPCSTAAA